MRDHPDDRAELQARIELSARVEVQLTGAAEYSPLKALLKLARQRANDAREKLAAVDAENPKAIRALQNEIRGAYLIVEWLHEIVVAGKDADQMLEVEDEGMVDDILDSEDDDTSPDPLRG